MRRVKQILSGVLALTMAASLAACGNDDNPSSGADATTTTEATTSTSVTVAKNKTELND